MINANATKNSELSSQVEQLKFFYIQSSSSYNKKDKTGKLNYLKYFPKNAKEFNFLFGDPKLSPLYNATQYILKLESLVEDYPIQIVNLLTKLCSEMQLTNRSSEHLQLVFMKVVINYSNQFAQAFNQLSHSEQQDLLQFMTSGKTGPATGYSSLQHILIKTNHTKIANQMESALNR